MTFPQFWHWLFSSRYTLRLEDEIRELKAEIETLRQDRDELVQRVLNLAKRPVMPATEEDADPRVLPQRSRPGRFVSFGSAKRKLESQEPPQRSVNV